MRCTGRLQAKGAPLIGKYLHWIKLRVEIEVRIAILPPCAETPVCARKPGPGQR